jgi:hypothetical protein
MFDKVNLEEELYKSKENQDSKSEKTLSAFKALFQSEWEREQKIRGRLATRTKGVVEVHNNLPEKDIFTIDQIQSLCLKFRLRFLPSDLFKGSIPDEAIFKVRRTETLLGKEIPKFFLLAPESVFRLGDANKDPLLFAPLTDGRFLFLHKWGNDLSPWHRVMAWPLQNPVNLLLTVGFVAVVFALLLPSKWFTNPGVFSFERLAMVFWAWIVGMSLTSYFWFVLNKKFSLHAWRNPYFN